MKLDTRGRRLVDDRGRTVILRGVNFSGRHKQPPHTFATSRADLEPLRDLGCNVIRLVLVWEAIEPERGRFDADYLERIERISTWAGELGIRVVMDLHQDIYSRAFGGSGAPEWSIDPAITERYACDDPGWFLRYGTSDAVRESLARFWRNDDGLLDHFVAAMVEAAKRLAPHPEVIGWEIYNEPFSGALDLETFETERLQPFYERAIAEVRAVAPDWLCFYEGALFISEMGTKLDLSRFERMVYFPHFYVKAAHAGRAYDGDTREMDRAFARFEADAARLDQPWMLGEYGMIVDADGAVRYLTDHENALAAYGAGSTVWQYNPTELDWNDERMSIVNAAGDTPLAAAFVRPYPAAIAGDDVTFSYDMESGDFELRFTASSDEETEICVPRRAFPRGAAVHLSAGNHAWREGDRLIVRAPPGSAVELKLSRK